MGATGDVVIMDEDELLVAALGDVGERVGTGTGSGAEFAAQHLRKDVCELSLSVSMPPKAAAERVRDVLALEGRVLEVETVPGGEEPPATRILGMVGAGFGNLNPAVVTITVTPAADGAQVLVRGVAKEGVLRQHAGEAAARRVATAIGCR